MLRRYLAAALASAAVLLGVAIGWPEPALRQADSTHALPGAPETKGSSSASSGHRDWQRVGRQPRFQSGLETLPASLAGTDVPDGLRVDADGSLQVSQGLRDVFDYFLSVLGEEDIDTVVARIRAYLDDQLPPAAAAQAQRILEDYLAFRDSLADLMLDTQQAQSADITAIRQHQQAIRDRRQQYLGASVDEAFFASQDRWDDFGLARLAVMQDDQRSAQDKAAALTALRQDLPGELQADMDAVMRHQDLKALTRELTASGGTDADLRLLREQVVGAEAADRLEALEANRAQFQQRLSHWLSLRASVLTDSALAPADRQQQLAQLRTQYFVAEEQQRVVALEQLHDQQTAP